MKYKYSVFFLLKTNLGYPNPQSTVITIRQLLTKHTKSCKNWREKCYKESFTLTIIIRNDNKEKRNAATRKIAIFRMTRRTFGKKKIWPFLYRWLLIFPNTFSHKKVSFIIKVQYEIGCRHVLRNKKYLIWQLLLCQEQQC